MKTKKRLLSILLSLALVLGLMPGMGLTAYAADYTSLTDGQVLHVGDTFTPEINYYNIAGYTGWRFANIVAPYKLVRVNVTPSAYDPSDLTVEESADGQYYGFYVSGWNSYGIFPEYNGGISGLGIFVCEATATSDGLTVKRNGDAVSFVVHEGVAVTGVTLGQTSATLTAGGDPVKLTATVSPEDATDKTVKWDIASGKDKVTLYSDADCKTPLALDTATDKLTVYAKGLAAGTATVVASSNETFSIYDECAVTVNPVTYEVTYQVVNGIWSDGSTTDKKETVADGTKPASVPTGMKAASGFTGGAWDIDPASATITGAKTFTYSFTAKQAATVTKAPTAKSLTYTGSGQALVDAGTASGGEMQYALGTAAEATEPYTTSIPAKTEAGTYYVWYKAVGDDNHNDSEAKPVEVTIATGDTDAAAPKEQTLTYTGSAQSLVKAGTVEGGTLFYALGKNNTTAPTDGWSTEVPPATEAGTYYVWYKVEGDANHKDVDPACIVVTIGEAAKSETPAEQPAAAPAASTSDYTLLASLKTSGKKALKMSWTAVPDAQGYDIFFGQCNTGQCHYLDSTNAQSYKIKGLKKGNAYKAFVRAWKMAGSEKVYIGEASPDVHAIAGGRSNKYTNPKKISVKKKKLTLSVGGSKTIKAKLKKFSDSREYLNHVSAKVRYYSSDRTVATVDASGRVTGVGPGKCTVFAVAENGIRVGVKITVK